MPVGLPSVEPRLRKPLCCSETGAMCKEAETELTLFGEGRWCRSRAELSDEDLVASVLRELSEAADKWEALLAEAETITYSVDRGDIREDRLLEG